MIVAGRSDGLGARLANLMNAIRISRKYDLELRVLCARLPPGHHYDGTFDDLFSGTTADLFELIEGTAEDWYAKNLQVGFKGVKFRPFADWEPVYESGESKQQVDEDLKSIFRAMGFSDAISGGMQLIDTWMAANCAESTPLAVHMRCGDVRHNVARWFPEKYLPEYLYTLLFDKIAVEAPGHRVYLATDHPNKQKFKDKYPVLSLADVIPLAELKKIEADLLELYFISRCSVIYAASSSAFSVSAAMIGNIDIVDVGEYTIGTELIAMIQEMLKQCEKQTLHWHNRRPKNSD